MTIPADVARRARHALDRYQFGRRVPATGPELADVLDIGLRSLRRYEAEGGPELYRWALVGLLYVELGRGGPEGVKGLVPGADDATRIASQRREL